MRRGDGRAQSPRLWRLARQLAELSRLEQGLEQPVLGPVELETLLSTLCRGYRDVTLDIHETAAVMSDPRHLAGVLLPILENALLHGASPVKVALTGAQITVSDCGPGFSPDLLLHATERFVTGSQASGRGVGLGLPLAVAHARLINATLELSNSPACGATVAIRLVD